jgi:hypothetical protein
MRRVRGHHDLRIGARDLKVVKQRFLDVCMYMGFRLFDDHDIEQLPVAIGFKLNQFQGNIQNIKMTQTRAVQYRSGRKEPSSDIWQVSQNLLSSGITA